MDVMQATKEIAAILESLEVDQKATVLSMSIKDTDITRPIDVIPQSKREVVIVMDKKPGSNWVKGI